MPVLNILEFCKHCCLFVHIKYLIYMVCIGMDEASTQLCLNYERFTGITVIFILINDLIMTLIP